MKLTRYEERIMSLWTECLFILLTVLFFLLYYWLKQTSELLCLTVVCLVLCVVFLFYSLNYLILLIQITDDFLVLRFGLITWKLPLESLSECRLDDDLPWYLKFGGAGIHGYQNNHRYRISFNFLEHPRVAVTLKKKKGPAQEVSFSIRQPELVLRILNEAIASDARGLAGSV